MPQGRFRGPNHPIRHHYEEVEGGRAKPRRWFPRSTLGSAFFFGLRVAVAAVCALRAGQGGTARGSDATLRYRSKRACSQRVELVLFQRGRASQTSVMPIRPPIHARWTYKLRRSLVHSGPLGRSTWRRTGDLVQRHPETPILRCLSTTGTPKPLVCGVA